MMRRFAAVLVLLLGGCAASAQTRSASINLNALFVKHPLYVTLAQYDRQIAALQATLNTRFADSGAQIANASAAIGRDLDQASEATRNQSRAAANQPKPSMPPPGAQQNAPTASAIESGIQTSYIHQRDELQGTAQRDMAAYRATLLGQERIAFDRFVQSVQARTQRAYEARAQELRERESALLLELARANAPTRLVVRTKLQTLALDTQTRRRLTNRLVALQDREDIAIAALRSTNARTLAAYASVLHERAQRDVAKMHADLQTRTSANLAARERVLAAQTSSGGSLHMPTAQSHAGSEAEMLSQYNALVNAPSPDASPYANARSQLAERFKALGAADAADTQSVKSQIASLAHDRAAVVERIRSQIMLEAKREAKARDLWLIYTSGLTPRGSVDITAAVAADLKQLSP